MSLRHALLGLLADRPHNGWQLLKHFEGSLTYAWPALHSQIYPELARLRESGLIVQTGAGPAARRSTRSRRPARRRSSAGSAGLRRVALPCGTRRCFGVFFLWLLEADESAEYLDREAAYHRALLADLEQIAAAEEPVSAKDRAYRLALDYGLRTVRARLEWAEWAAPAFKAAARQPR